MAKLQLLCHRLIARQVGLMEIIQQATAFPDHFQQAASGTVVLEVLLQMLGQVINPLRQKGHLNVRRPGVLIVQLKASDRLSFFHIIYQINSIFLQKQSLELGQQTVKLFFGPFRAIRFLITDGHGSTRIKTLC